MDYSVPIKFTMLCLVYLLETTSAEITSSYRKIIILILEHTSKHIKYK